MAVRHKLSSGIPIKKLIIFGTRFQIRLSSEALSFSLPRIFQQQVPQAELHRVCQVRHPGREHLLLQGGRHRRKE